MPLIGGIRHTEDVGKKSRRASRRNRPKRERRSASIDPLRIVIATSPESSSDGLSLAKDVELVRAAVLYADEVELVSPGAAILAALVEFAAGDDAQMIELMGSFDAQKLGQLGATGLPDNWLEAVKGMYVISAMNPELLTRLSGGAVGDTALDAARNLRHTLAESMMQIRQVADRVLSDSKGIELVPAFRAGLLKLSPSGVSEEAGDVQDVVTGFVEILKQLLRDPKSHLLLDDDAASLVRSLVDEGHIEPSKTALNHAGRAAVGSGFITRLPAFTQAPIDELLDLRRDLNEPLSRYRKAVARIAAMLTGRAFDPELSAEIDDLWRTEVEPALYDMRQGFVEHGLVREIARQISTDVRSLAAAGVGPGIAVSIDSITDLGTLVSIASGLTGGGLALAQQVAKAKFRRRDAIKDIEQHELYYLYELDRRL